MQSARPLPTGLTKRVPVRFSHEEYRLLHKIAPKGGIHALIRSWIDESLKEAKRLDEECEGK
jgi:hypothetical protein